MSRIAPILLSLLAFAGVDARAQQVAVFVTAVDDGSPILSQGQLEGAVKEAQARMFAIATDVRKAHGDKRQGWPPDAVDTVVSAENAYNTAIARRDYYGANTRLDLDSAVEELVKQIGKSKVLTLAAAATGAELLVEVIGRRTAHPPGVTDARFFIRTRVRPGPALPDERFRAAAASHQWGPDFLSRTFARPTAASPKWDAETGSNASFKLAASIAEGMIENFARAVARTPR